MEVAVSTLFLGFNPKIMSHSHQTLSVVYPNLSCRRRVYASSHDNFAGELYTRKNHKCFPTISAVLSGAKDVEVSSCQFGDFSVTTDGSSESGEVKISVEVFGTKTQSIFDQVFDKMVAQAQPIPGFRRVKGGKTPNVPKPVLLEFLGPSKVFKQVIKKIINSCVAEYVEKEGLKVSKDLRVEQSFEDLQSTFEAGENFNFDAVLQLQEIN